MCGQPRSQRRRQHSPSSGMTRLWGREQFPLESTDWRAQWTFDYRVEADRGVLEKTGPEPMGGKVGWTKPRRGGRGKWRMCGSILRQSS